MTDDEMMKYRAEPGIVAMVNAAKGWLNDNPNELPDFERREATVLSGNGAADDIEEVIVKAGHVVGKFVTPNTIWNVTVFALDETGRLPLT